MTRISFGLCSLVIVQLIAFAACEAFSQDRTEDPLESMDSSAVARIVEFVTPIALSGPDSIPQIGAMLGEEDTTFVNQGGSITLIFRDGSVRKYNGPTTLTFSGGDEPEGGGILAEITKLTEVLFGKHVRRDARLGVRKASLDIRPAAVPLVLYPLDGSLLPKAPSKISWQPIEAISVYRVSIFDNQRLILRDIVNGSVFQLAGTNIDFSPGIEYTCVIEACVQDSYIRSRDVSFEIATEDRMKYVADAVRGIEEGVDDPRLRSLLVAQTNLDFGLYEQYLGELDRILAASPGDRTVTLSKILFFSDRGRYEEAIDVAKGLLLGQ